MTLLTARPLYLAVSVILATSTTGQANQLAEGMCDAYMPVLANAYTFRQQGVPIAATQEMATSAMDVDINLYRFLIAAINFTYEDPEAARDAFQTGRMKSVCVENVRGF